MSTDFYKDINPDIEKRFDTNDYLTNHPSGIKTGLNSKVLGMFKDEAGGKLIVEFVGLRAKLYSYKMLDGSEEKKGWQRVLQEGVFNSMTMESACLAGRINIEKWMSYEVIVMRFIPKKLLNCPLSSVDDKRVIMADAIHILAYGHTNLKKW